eukprot:scaffold26859_cov59-Cyclotella_meneghiniana.AAC.6
MSIKEVDIHPFPFQFPRFIQIDIVYVAIITVASPVGIVNQVIKRTHVLGSAQRWLPPNKAPPRSAFHRSSALPNTFHGVWSDRARTAARFACGRDSSNGGRGRGSLPSQNRRNVLPISPCGPIAMGMKH